MKKIVPTITLTLVIILTLTYVLTGSLNKKNQKEVQAKITNSWPILYYGKTCPHCKLVDEWIKKNNLEKKIKIKQKEVFYNETNKSEAIAVEKKCNLDSSQVLVPLLYAEKKCYLGQVEVINYFAKKIGAPLVKK